MTEAVAEKKYTDASLNINAALIRAIFEQSPVGIELYDKNGMLIDANEAALNIFGLDSIESVKGFNFFKDPNIAPYQIANIKKGISVKYESTFDFDLVRKNLLYETTKSGKIDVSVHITPLKEGNGCPGGYLVHVEDISERKQSEFEYKTFIHTTMEGFWIVDTNGRILDINDAYCQLIGYSREELLKMKIPDLEANEKPEDTAEHIRRIIETGSDRFETRHRRKDGAIIDIEISVKYINVRSGRFFLFARDITEQKRSENKIRYISFHDKTTGLYNRAYGEEEIKRLGTGRELPVSIIMGDINYLKLTNDAFGHEEGDKLLKSVSAIMQYCCRDEDIIVRWGGDEFVVILPKTDYPAAEALARRIANSVRQPADNMIFAPSIALGIATKTQYRDNIYQILRIAEDKMYKNKMLESRYNQELLISSLLRNLRAKIKTADEALERVKYVFSAFGRQLGLADNEISDLNLLFLLHELGKISIPDYVLMKPGPLSADEFAIMRKHSETGYYITRGISAYAPLADMVLSIHENWDGKGYPRGLTSDAIPYQSRILNIVISYDAMIHESLYKRAFSRKEAIEELKRNAGKQFDPYLIESFIINGLIF